MREYACTQGFGSGWRKKGAKTKQVCWSACHPPITPSFLPSFLPSFCILCLLVFTSTILSTGIVQNSVRLPKKVSSLPCMMMHAKTVLLVLHVDRSSNLQSFCTACLHVHTLCVCVCVCVCVYVSRTLHHGCRHDATMLVLIQATCVRAARAEQLLAQKRTAHLRRTGSPRTKMTVEQRNYLRCERTPIHSPSCRPTHLKACCTCMIGALVVWYVTPVRYSISDSDKEVY